MYDKVECPRHTQISVDRKKMPIPRLAGWARGLIELLFAHFTRVIGSWFHGGLHQSDTAFDHQWRVVLWKYGDEDDDSSVLAWIRKIPRDKTHSHHLAGFDTDGFVVRTLPMEPFRALIHGIQAYQHKPDYYKPKGQD